MFLLKVDHGNGGDQLKLTGMVGHMIGNGLYLFCDGGKPFTRNIVSPYLNTLTELLDIRGDIQAGTIAGTAQNRLQHGAGGTFSIASGNVNEFKLLLGIAQSVQQLPRPF